MLANRVFTSSVVVRSVRASVGCRYYASKPTSTPPPPPSKPTTTTAAPTQAKTAAPTQAKTSPTQGLKSTVSTPRPLFKTSSYGIEDLEFTYARANLPIRLYSKHGNLASRLYVIAEKSSKGEVDKVATSLQTLSKELTAHPKLYTFLSSAANTPVQKKALLVKLNSYLKFPPTLATFLENLAEKRGTKDILKIARDFDTLIKARDKVVKVKLTVASKDQPKPKIETIQKILNYDKDTKINLEVIVDPSIEGGAILAGPDRYVDYSFKKELTALKAVLAKKSAEAQNAKRTQFLQALSQYENVVSP